MVLFYRIIILLEIPNPSKMDIKMTQIIIEAAQTIGMCFIDHIIIGKNKYYSFVERKVTNLYDK